MARLGNARHEQFAQAIANGAYPTQEAAYVACGYKPDHAKSHASHLAKRPDVAKRIEELQGQALAPVIGGDARLAEMGITIQWLFAQYDLIRSRCIEAGDMKTASACIKNVQTLIDLEERLATEKADKQPAGGRIDIDAIAARMMESASKIVAAAKDQPAAAPYPDAISATDQPAAHPTMKALRAAENET